MLSWLMTDVYYTCIRQVLLFFFFLSLWFQISMSCQWWIILPVFRIDIIIKSAFLRLLFFLFFNQEWSCFNYLAHSLMPLPVCPILSNPNCEIKALLGAWTRGSVNAVFTSTSSEFCWIRDLTPEVIFVSRVAYYSSKNEKSPALSLFCLFRFSKKGALLHVKTSPRCVMSPQGWGHLVMSGVGSRPHTLSASSETRKLKI